MNQDPLGKQARRFMDMGNYEIWAKELVNGEIAVCFMNRSEDVWKLDHDWRKNAMYFIRTANFRSNTYTVRDLWQHRDIATTDTTLKTDVPPHGVLMVRLSPIK